jgi:hypothetical protein
LVYDFLQIKRIYEDWRENVERDSWIVNREDKALVLDALSSLRDGIILNAARVISNANLLMGHKIIG